MRDWIAAAGLFLATAGVVLWQNAHVAVLWDLSYVLDSAARIAQGQMPYRDFPFAHAPLTFLIQAAIIRITGRVFFHHVVYAAVVGGLGTVLAWRIVLHTLRGRVAWAVALLLAAPLMVLGIYCILPLPSYDCDCGFALLVAVWLLQRVESGAADKKIKLARGGAAGVAVCVPVFFKQNIGLPFLSAVVAAVLLLLGVALIRRGRLLARGIFPGGAAEPDAAVLWAVLAGVGATLLGATLVLHWTVGLGNYVHWTIRFAAQRRLPGLGDMLGVYHDPSLLWTLPCVVVALLLLRSPLAKARIAALVLLAAPFLFAVYALFLYDDADERGDSLLALWPLLLVLAGALTAFNLFRRRRSLSLRALLPVVVLVAINGTLMSQQLWGSTYAIWPLLVLLIAEMIVFLAGEEGLSEEHETHVAGAKAQVYLKPHSARLKSCPDTRPFHASGRVDFRVAGSRLALAMAAVISATLLVCGGFYMASEERLSYAQLPDEPAQHSSFPQLAGMATPGPYLPDFDELLRFADANIPANDGVILLPGEDPFYFVTGRMPRFPVLLFDPATDPYSPGQVVDEARRHEIRWLIVKRALQIKADPTPQREATMKALLADFTLSLRLHGYDVYRR